MKIQGVRDYFLLGCDILQPGRFYRRFGGMSANIYIYQETTIITVTAVRISLPEVTYYAGNSLELVMKINTKLGPSRRVEIVTRCLPSVSRPFQPNQYQEECFQSGRTTSLLLLLCDLRVISVNVFTQSVVSRRDWGHDRGRLQQMDAARADQ